MFLSTDWVNAAMKAGRGIRMGLVVRVGCARWGMFMSDLRDVKGGCAVVGFFVEEEEEGTVSLKCSAKTKGVRER